MPLVKGKLEKKKYDVISIFALVSFVAVIIASCSGAFEIMKNKHS